MAAGLVKGSATPAGCFAQRPRLQAGVVAASLLRPGTAALDAGAADAGVETLRRAVQEASRAGDLTLQAEVQRALGSALVHAVRGSDGEAAVVLHRALLTARAADRPAMVADILRELAFVDVQAGRHASADLALREASQTCVRGSCSAGRDSRYGGDEQS